MTTRGDFSDEEWEVLVRAPLLACWAVIAAAPSGSVGTVGEVQAMVGEMSDTRRDASDELVGVLARSLSQRINQSELRVRELPVEVLRQRAVEAMREATGLLDAKGAAQVRPGFRDWIVSLAQAVAAASKEAGGLGEGGKVQPAEAGLIDELRRALDEGVGNG